MIYDNFEDFTEAYNGEGLYWNYFYHVWKTFSISPFANNTLFVAGAPTVTGVSVTPSSATVAKGQKVALTASVDTTNFAPKTVYWTSSVASIDVSPSGVVSIPVDTTASSVSITATSTFNSLQSAIATLTIE
jgi:hypothetical protein